MKTKSLTLSKEAILACVHLGISDAGKIAKNLNTTRETVQRELEELEQEGLVAKEGTFFKSYVLSAEGKNRLGNAKIELNTVRDAAVVKSGAFSKLRVTATNAGRAPTGEACIRIISPKVFSITREGCDYDNDPEHTVLEFPLDELHAGEAQSILFDMRGVLPSGVLSSKYKITVQAFVGKTQTDKREISVIIESESKE
ncbi:hypothetical protein COX86_03240 [Candidatus Micrarchaeota archaeon CG_4_10_14_0_2_um_filter_60_11]|nr:MAG: hypothetical protein AUJ16_04310 [Candidatus Micrarchaeota archaeon CG1_02_60_51]PIN95747.1 MAG: hypothetical protein COU39_04285 [Candidatus Micrarchaeota archaeon CG10_big_fil_rev_8_21_14_0_10_60_32]PIO01679.1 MAG: hypothetical protein COT58_03905 [Candidatus Micrarchaeota archaeon CG09_land_8_20_14_0_10_60_16]PIY91220.1 MAG: hypothetical protein COY71_04345 [Candidatus Micrarchaeota archaeon CG_4_10_14_0_8_um_filter_60_7]PIZ90766.1 MAG: hypothetical protein COX86_03240 [Candidatus Mi